MLPRSAANATKPVSYRQRGETGHSTAKGGGAVDHRLNPSDRLGTGAPAPLRWCAVDRYRNVTRKGHRMALQGRETRYGIQHCAARD